MRRTMALAVLGLAVGLAVTPAEAAIKRSMLLTSFETRALPREDAWVGDGIAEALSLAFVHHPAFVQIERGRARAFGEPGSRSEADVLKAARALRADVTVFGEVHRSAGNFVIRPRYLVLKDGAGEPATLPDMTVPDSELMKQLGALPAAYMKALGVTLAAAEAARLDAAARPTTSDRKSVV